MIGDSKMNLPYCLIKSLGKMSNKVNKYLAYAKTSLAQHSLITTLVYYELYQNQIDERIFLENAGFDLKEEIEKKNAQKKKRSSTGSAKKPSKKQHPANIKARVINSKPEIKFTYERKVAGVLNSEAAKCKTKKQNNKKMKGNISVMKFEMDTDKKKGKPLPEGKIRFTRPTNRLRINAKAIKNLALKFVEPICIELDSPEPLIKKRKVGVSSITIDSLL